MKKKTNTAKRRFTLVELLVSMGVLVIILSFILQFFIGSQRLWRSMEQRNNLYADARVAMDIMTTMLQNSFYSEGGIPFRIYHPDSSEEKFRHKIYFATQSTQNLPGGRLKYVSFQLGDGKKDGTGEKDELKIAVFCDLDEDDFTKYFPPYGLEGVADLHDALTQVCDKLDGQLTNTTAKDDPDKDDELYGSVLIRGVTSFQIIPYRLEFDDKFYDGKAKDYYYIYRIPDSDSDFVDGKNGKYYDNDPETTSEGKPYKLPFMVELKLTMLSPADFKIWKAMSGEDDGNPEKIDDSDNNRVKFRKTHAYTFARTVFLGEQSRMNINEE